MVGTGAPRTCRTESGAAVPTPGRAARAERREGGRKVSDQPVLTQVLELRPYGQLGSGPQRPVNVRVHLRDDLRRGRVPLLDGGLDLRQPMRAVREVELDGSACVREYGPVAGEHRV